MKLNLSPLAVTATAVLALTVLIGRADTVHAGSFNPTLQFSVADPAAGANSDLTLNLEIPEGDVQFAAVVQFIPPEWGITRGEEIPLGAVVGVIRATATLGLINGACNSVLPVEFSMLNASIDPTDTVSYLDDDDDGDQDYLEDRDNSGLMDGVEKYPAFITRVLTDESDEPLQPLRRSAGMTIIGGVNVLLQFLIFEPGTFIDERISNDAELGFPTVTLLQNIGDPESDPIPGAITDFCTPLETTITSLGISKDNGCTGPEEPDPICDVTSAVIVDEGGADPDEGGIPLATNPSEGTYTFTFIGAGQRDADGDGFENSLDTCPFTPNEGDPRVKGDGDFDEDGLDAACDPNDDPLTGGTNSDEDLDGFTNRQDNCPIVENGEFEDNQRDTDDDAIGDACDPNPDEADTEGELVFVQLDRDVEIGPGDGPPPAETPTDGSDGDTPSEGDDDGGSATIFIIIGVIAAVVVVGGGAFFFMRRGGSA